MPIPTPAFLLDHPELVHPVAPWCTWLENHELGILLLAQPWLAGPGLRRSELQASLERLAADLPVGPVYFQRVSRAAEALEERSQLVAEGGGRARRYRTTASGLAALLLNVQVLRADPTVDGSEFELKRALVALWNLVAGRMAGVSDGQESSLAMARVLDELEGLTVWGQPVITDQVVDDAFDVLRLIRTQREGLARLEQEARQRLTTLAARHRLVAPEAARRGRRGPKAAAQAGPDLREALAIVRVVATGVAPRLGCEAALLRYRAYGDYLDRLAKLYARELRVVDLATMRRALSAGRP